MYDQKIKDEVKAFYESHYEDNKTICIEYGIK